jgi:hypothetical protein
MIETFTEVEKIIYNSLLRDPNLVQTDSKPEDVVLAIRKDCENSMSYAIQQGNFVMLLQPENKHLARVHFFSEDMAYSWIKHGKKITKFIFDQFPFQKIYNYFGDERMARVGKRGGWKYEGKMERAYWDGEKYTDLYIGSASRDDYEKYWKDA